MSEMKYWRHRHGHSRSFFVIIPPYIGHRCKYQVERGRVREKSNKILKTAAQIMDWTRVSGPSLSQQQHMWKWRMNTQGPGPKNALFRPHVRVRLVTDQGLHSPMIIFHTNNELFMAPDLTSVRSISHRIYKL